MFEVDIHVEFMLPKKPGLDVCLDLRSTPHGESSAIVIMSCRFRSRQYRSQSHSRFRVDEFVEKPIDLEKLTAVLERHLPAKNSIEVVVETAANPEEKVESEQPTEESQALAVNPESADNGLTGEINDRIDSLLGS